MKVKLFNKKVFSIILSVIMLISVIPVGAVTANAETSGYYTYSVSNGKATITDCSTSIIGDITIPSKLGGYPVTSIGDNAFYGCENLTSATIPNSVKSIGDRAFFSCESLTRITIPNSVTSIGAGAFSGCESLTSITLPDSVTSIGENAFYGCISLTRVTIPNSVTSIGIGVFGSCESLTSIIVDKNNTTYDSRNDCNAIIETKTNKLIAGCKNTVILNSVTSIGDRAFFSCESLTSITIPNSVTSIGDSAFYYCISLTSATIPNSVKSIGNSAFEYCSSLTSITIPNSVTSIGWGVFSGCSSLTSITIPNSVTSIGDNAFSGCESLPSITIPSSVTSIGDSAFSGCKSLTSITIPNSVTSIGGGTFWSCESLTSITIPNSVTSIGYEAFYCCSRLTSITIPRSVTSIDDWAFYGCSSLTDVYYGGNEEAWNKISIGSDNVCLTSATIHYNESQETPSPSLSYTYSVTNGKVTITGYEGSISGDITIPSELGGYPVTSIGDWAFSCCFALTSVTIPNSVTSIGNYAFYWCDCLTDVYYGGYIVNWKKIRIGEGNESLLNSKIHYKSHSNHTYKTTVTKATTRKNGSIVKTCDCGAKTTTPVYYPKTFKLSTTSYTYDGKVKKPAVTVKDSAGKTISSANYTVTYASGRQYVGKYAVKVTFKGSYYSGSKMLYFNINPRNTSISKLTSGRKSFKVYLKKYTTQTTGYQIQYSTSSKFTGAKTVTVSNKTTAKTISKLYGGKRYYVRCRTYKKVGNTNFFSSWSGAKAVTTRK